MRIAAELTRHELVIAAKTKRLLVVSLVYVAAAVLGSLAYSYALREIEAAALAALDETGMDPIRAAAAYTLTSNTAYTQLVAFFAGAPVEELAESVLRSAPVPVYFWASLTFLPFLIGFTSFDVVQSDLHNRTLCYSTLRASRRTLLLAKFVAHLITLTLVSGLAALAFLLLTTVMVKSVELGTTVPGMLRVWLFLIPVGAAYLALTTTMSTLTKRAAAALAFAVTGVFLLRVFYWLGAIPEESSYALLRYLRYVSPVTYQDSLWRAGILTPFTGVLAFAVFTAVFLFLAERRLQGRDL